MLELQRPSRTLRATISFALDLDDDLGRRLTAPAAAGRFTTYQVEAYIRCSGRGLDAHDIERGKCDGIERSTVN
jgi:hypothetical protein